MSAAEETNVRLSFEVFPARDEVGEEALRRSVSAVGHFNPRFVSVTYGADGGESRRTLESIQMLQERTGQKAFAGHITCVGATRDDALDYASAYERDAETRWCVALRGDSPNGAHAAFDPHPNGFADSVEMVAALRAKTGMKIAIGGYPEPHPASIGAQADIDHLKRKVDAGADAIITQFFFENDLFLAYRDRCSTAGIDIPIIPGIMPIKKFAAIARFARRCGATIPARLADRFKKAAECGAERELALAVCAGQCDDLREEGVQDFHFYTLNDASLSVGTCQALGLDPLLPVDGDGLPLDTLIA